MVAETRQRGRGTRAGSAAAGQSAPAQRQSRSPSRPSVRSKVASARGRSPVGNLCAFLLPCTLGLHGATRDPTDPSALQAMSPDARESYMEAMDERLEPEKRSQGAQPPHTWSSSASYSCAPRSMCPPCRCSMLETLVSRAWWVVAFTLHCASARLR